MTTLLSHLPEHLRNRAVHAFALDSAGIMPSRIVEALLTDCLPEPDRGTYCRCGMSRRLGPGGFCVSCEGVNEPGGFAAKDEDEERAEWDQFNAAERFDGIDH